MSSNHLSIEPAPPENAHNHHSSLIEGCTLCYPLNDLKKIEELGEVQKTLMEINVTDESGTRRFVPEPTSNPRELKPDGLIEGWQDSYHNSHETTLNLIERLLHQQAKQSYSQGREDGIRELYNLYGEPRCEYLHHPRSTQHRASEECPVEKRIKLLLNQKQDE